MGANSEFFDALELLSKERGVTLSMLNGCIDCIHIIITPADHLPVCRIKRKSLIRERTRLSVWRRVRDSNPRCLLGTQHFECCTFDLSDNSPSQIFKL